MFFGFWERGSAEKSEGIMGSNIHGNNDVILILYIRTLLC